MLAIDGPDTDVEPKAIGESHAPDKLDPAHLNPPSQSQEAAERTKEWGSLQLAVQFEIFNEKPQPSLPPVGINSGPAAEGGAKFQVNHPPLLALDPNSTDPLLACPWTRT